MAYTAPLTVITGDLATAAQYNTYTKDNIIALAAGYKAIASQAALDFTYAESATQEARLAKGLALQYIRLNEAATGYEFAGPDIRSSLCATDFETAVRFPPTVVNAGATSLNSTGALIDTSATGTSSAKMRWQVVSAAATGGVFVVFPAEFGISFIVSVLGTDLQSFHGIGNITVGGSSVTYTSNHIGFKLVRSASGACSLYATQANGATETASAALTTVVLNDYLELSIHLSAADSISYYWRKNGGSWSIATTLTTNAPTAGDAVECSIAVSNVATATRSVCEHSSAYYKR